MTLRGAPIHETATLPDGRAVEVVIGVPDDPYISKQDLDTVDVEIRAGGDVLAAVNTILDADQMSEARALARDVARGLEAGELEPTGGAIEPLANAPR